MKRIYVNETWRLRCHLCEYNCAFANSGEEDMVKALKGKPFFPRKQLFVKDDRLCGFVLLGNVDRAGIYTALVREKRPLSSLDFEAVKQSPGLLPFGAQYRGQTLGGVV